MTSTAYDDPGIALEGMLANSDHTIDSVVLTAPVKFGAPAYRTTGADDAAGPATTDTLAVTFSADLVTGNVVAGTWTDPVTGEVTNVSVTYATSSAATLTALMNQLSVIDGVDIVSLNTTTRVLTLRSGGANIAAALALTVTGGASQATVSQATSTSQRLAGVLVRSQIPYTAQDGTLADPDGSGGYAYPRAEDAANLLVRGRCWVLTAEAVDSDTPAYLTPAGAWVMTTTNNTLTPYYFRSSTDAAGLAILEVAPVVGKTTT